MKIAIITLFPEMFEAVSAYGVSGRAASQGLVELQCFNPRTFATDKHATVDDRPYGGGPGMVMMIEPLREAIATARNWTGATAKVIYLSPQGRLLTQSAINAAAENGAPLILIAGRYEGIDERLIELEVDEEWSIGDYVVSGGELPAMVVIDAIIRMLPGALGDSQSAEQDSFAEGLLDCPHYTRPEDYQGHKVPAVLLSGNHDAIRRWRLLQTLRRTRMRRPELLRNKVLDAEQEQLLQQIESDEFNDLS